MAILALYVPVINPEDIWDKMVPSTDGQHFGDQDFQHEIFAAFIISAGKYLTLLKQIELIIAEDNVPVLDLPRDAPRRAFQLLQLTENQLTHNQRATISTTFQHNDFPPQVLQWPPNTKKFTKEDENLVNIVAKLDVEAAELELDALLALRRQTPDPTSAS